MSKKDEKRANNILDDEIDFWRSDTAGAICSIYSEMRDAGVPEDVAKQWVQSIYSAARGEYGD